MKRCWCRGFAGRDNNSRPARAAARNCSLSRKLPPVTLDNINTSPALVLPVGGVVWLNHTFIGPVAETRRLVAAMALAGTVTVNGVMVPATMTLVTGVEFVIGPESRLATTR